MKIDIIAQLKKYPLFSTLDDITLKKLLKKFKKIHLARDEILFQQGELTDEVYLLIRGNIHIYFSQANRLGENRIANIQPGETIGELSALSKEPRSVSAVASERSLLLMLTGKHFRDFCQESPAVALSTIHTLVERSNQLLQLLSEKKPQARYITLAPANPSIHLKKFSEMLMLHTQNKPHVTLLSDYDPEFRRRYHTLSDLEALLNSLEKEDETIICLLESHETLLGSLSFRSNRLIYVTAHFDSEPMIHPFLKDKIRQHAHPTQLLLLQKKETRLPLPPTAKWLNLAPFELNHTMDPDQTEDQERLLRFMSGQAYGLVLGGGGLRSWAHLGALEAILEAGIPIDMIGGTSAGAIVAAHYLLHGIDKKAQKGLRELSEITRKIISFKNLTWPTLSLFNTNQYVEKQKELFDNILIEELSLPCFFVSCNLSKNVEVIHRQGLLWKAITSSTSVPAIFPPFVVDGELQVDGGILNNLPVDVMKRALGPSGKIIAVELTRYDQFNQRYNYPPGLTTWETWMVKLGLSKKHYHLPSFLDVFLNSLLAGSAYKQEENSRQANLLIKPNLSKFGLINVSQKQETELVRIGRRSARASLSAQ